MRINGRNIIKTCWLMLEFRIGKLKSDFLVYHRREEEVSYSPLFSLLKIAVWHARFEFEWISHLTNCTRLYMIDSSSSKLSFWVDINSHRLVVHRGVKNLHNIRATWNTHRKWCIISAKIWLHWKRISPLRPTIVTITWETLYIRHHQLKCWYVISILDLV